MVRAALRDHGEHHGHAEHRGQRGDEGGAARQQAEGDAQQDQGGDRAGRVVHELGERGVSGILQRVERDPAQVDAGMIGDSGVADGWEDGGGAQRDAERGDAGVDGESAKFLRARVRR